MIRLPSGPCRRLYIYISRIRLEGSDLDGIRLAWNQGARREQGDEEQSFGVVYPI